MTDVQGHFSLRSQHILNKKLKEITIKKSECTSVTPHHVSKKYLQDIRAYFVVTIGKSDFKLCPPLGTPLLQPYGHLLVF